MTFGETQRALQKEAAKPGKDFGELVRERRRRFGHPSPPAAKVLPFRVSTPRAPSDEGACEIPREEEVATAEVDLAPNARERPDDPTQRALHSAEPGMQEALETAALRGATSAELEQLEAAFASAELAYIAVSQRHQASGDVG